MKISQITAPWQKNHFMRSMILPRKHTELFISKPLCWGLTDCSRWRLAQFLQLSLWCTFEQCKGKLNASFLLHIRNWQIAYQFCLSIAFCFVLACTEALHTRPLAELPLATAPPLDVLHPLKFEDHHPAQGTTGKEWVLEKEHEGEQRKEEKKTELNITRQDSST